MNGCSIAIQYVDTQRPLVDEDSWKSYKKWDVIDVMPYDFPWGGGPDQEPYFRVLYLSNIPVDEAVEWVEPMEVLGVMVQKRLRYIAGEAPEAQWLRDICSANYFVYLGTDDQQRLRSLIRVRPYPAGLDGYSNH